MTRRQREPSFAECLRMMRSDDPATSTDGFHALLPRARDHVPELLEALAAEDDDAVGFWLLELIAAAKDPDLLPFFRELLLSLDTPPLLRSGALYGIEELDTKDARRLLYEVAAGSLEVPKDEAWLTSHRERLRETKPIHRRRHGP